MSCLKIEWVMSLYCWVQQVINKAWIYIRLMMFVTRNKWTFTVQVMPWCLYIIICNNSKYEASLCILMGWFATVLFLWSPQMPWVHLLPCLIGSIFSILISVVLGAQIHWVVSLSLLGKFTCQLWCCLLRSDFTMSSPLKHLFHIWCALLKYTCIVLRGA